MSFFGRMRVGAAAGTHGRWSQEKMWERFDGSVRLRSIHTGGPTINNDILRRLRYALELPDGMVLFGSAEKW